MMQVLFGPMVQLYPPGHPLDPERRDGLNGPEFARAITIGDNCWIGGGAIIMGERKQSAVALGTCVSRLHFRPLCMHAVQVLAC